MSNRKHLYEKIIRPATVSLMNKIFVESVRGVENIPKEGSAIIASNHASYFDFLIIPSVIRHRRTHIIAAKELAEHPLIGIYARNDKCVLINRTNPGIRFFKDSINILKNDNLLLVFPEGTRSSDGRLKEFKRAFVELAAITGAKIIPAAIAGSREILPKGGKMIRLKKCSVAFGRPINVDHARSKEEMEKISGLVWREVSKMLESASG